MERASGVVVIIWPFKFYENRIKIDCDITKKSLGPRKDGRWIFADQWNRKDNKCIGSWLIKNIK